MAVGATQVSRYEERLVGRVIRPRGVGPGQLCFYLSAQMTHAGLTLCGTDTATWLCVDLQLDSSHCGSCDTVCADGNNCQGSVCACSTGRVAGQHQAPGRMACSLSVAFRAILARIHAAHSQLWPHLAVSLNPQTRPTATAPTHRATLQSASPWRQVWPAGDGGRCSS